MWPPEDAFMVAVHNDKMSLLFNTRARLFQTCPQSMFPNRSCLSRTDRCASDAQERHRKPSEAPLLARRRVQRLGEWFPPTFTFSERQHAQSDVLLTNKQDRWGPRRFATVYTTLSNVGTRLLGHRTRIREAVLCREPAQLIRRTRIKRWKLRH